MKTLEMILPELLLSGWLGPTPSQVAADLGYRGRTTVGRIMKGCAGKEATAGFCHRINEKYGLDCDDLFKIDRYLELSRRFDRMRSKPAPDFTTILMQVIDNDYSGLDISDEEMAELMTLRHDSPLEFVGMLSFAYFRQPGSSLKALTELLRRAFPDRALGVAACSNYPSSPVALGPLPPRLKEIALGGMIIRCFCQDYVDATRYEGMIPLKGLSGRTYWSDGEQDSLIMLQTVMVNGNRNAYYEWFSVPRGGGRIENVAQLFFFDYGFAGIYLKDIRKSAWASYSATDSRIELRWLNDKVTPSVMERRWPEKSRELTELDASISDERLSERIMAAYRIDPVDRYRVVNVRVSRTEIELQTVDGTRFALDRNSLSFLRRVVADMEVLIYRDRDDNRLYAEWPDLGERLALDGNEQSSDIDIG